MNNINLLQVTEIKLKHLKQIPIVSYDRKDYQQLQDDLLNETTKALYWFNAEAANMGTKMSLWIIQNQQGQLKIMIPPEDGPAHEKYKNLPQLFVS